MFTKRYSITDMKIYQSIGGWFILISFEGTINPKNGAHRGGTTGGSDNTHRRRRHISVRTARKS